MDPEREEAARALFFAYEGSAFYMSRDGRESEFESLRVPAETKRRWLDELTSERLAAIGEPGGWRSVNSLVHHELLGHLPVVLETVPAGKPWERTAFLELAAQYVDSCAASPKGEATSRYSPTDLRHALQRIQDRASELARDHRMRGQGDRLAELRENIQRRLDASEGTPTTGPTIWRWDALNRRAMARRPHGE